MRSDPAAARPPTTHPQPNRTRRLGRTPPRRTTTPQPQQRQQNGLRHGPRTRPPAPHRRRLHRLDRLIIHTTVAAVAVIGLAVIVAGLYPAAWLAAVSGPLALAGLFAAGGLTALVSGRRAAR